MSEQQAGGFVHLRVRSAYSLLEGAIKADAIGKLAAAQDMPAVALTVGVETNGYAIKLIFAPFSVP